MLATQERAKVRITLTDCSSLVLDHDGQPLGVYLSDAGVELAEGDTPVVDGAPITTDTVLDPEADVTVVPYSPHG